jgi:hypothetical protein
MTETTIEGGSLMFTLMASLFLCVGLMLLLFVALIHASIGTVGPPAGMLAVGGWMLYSRPRSCSVRVSDDGQVKLILVFAFQTLAWTGVKEDIVGIVHETNKAAEDDAKSVVLDIHGIGSIWLWGWKLKDANQLGQALGTEGREVKVDRMPQSLSRRELVKLLSKST